MSVTVQDILSRTAALERTIISPTSGSALKAYANVPYSITAADMPLFVNFVGNLQQVVLQGSDELAQDFQEIRLYNLVLYLAPYGTGVQGEKFGLLSPYFDLVLAKMQAYPHLNNLPGIVNSRIVSDTGMGVVAFQDTKYFGIRFVLQVTSKTRRLLAAGE